MAMHQDVFEADGYRVSIYTTSLSSTLVSVDQCIEIRSPMHIAFPRGFVLKDGRVFCKNRAEGVRRYLRMVEIERVSAGCNVFILLKRLIPSVFDVWFVRKINQQSYLHRNREVIMTSAISILGIEGVDKMRLWDRIRWHHGDGDGDMLSSLGDMSEDAFVFD